MSIVALAQWHRIIPAVPQRSALIWRFQ